MNRYFWFLFGLALLALMNHHRHQPSAMKTSVADRFANEEVERKAVPHVVHGSGELQAVTAVNVVSRIAGQISEVRSKAGDIVTGGQVLATVRSSELLQRLAKTSAVLEAAKLDLQEKEAQLITAERELEKALLLRNRDLIAGRDLAESEAARDTARAQQALAQAQVTEQQAVLDQTRYLLTLSKLLAPFSGVVISRLVESGAYVQASTPVLIVALLDPLKVEVEISEADVDFVREGMRAEIRVDSMPDRVFEGRVAFLSRLTTSQTAAADIRLSNPGRLLAPGMRVRITLMQSGQQDEAFGTTFKLPFG